MGTDTKYLITSNYKLHRRVLFASVEEVLESLVVNDNVVRLNCKRNNRNNTEDYTVLVVMSRGLDPNYSYSDITNNTYDVYYEILALKGK